MERSRMLRSVFDTVFALKSLERIGDHAKNVSGHAMFVAIGKDPRRVAAEQELPAAGSRH
jgi:phosphate transport system protein